MYLVVFLVSALAVVPLMSFTGGGSPVEGNMGSSVGGYYHGLGIFDLDEGESVRYDLVANYEFFLVVRDYDSSATLIGPDYYEGPFLLNVTGMTLAGSFDAPYDGSFLIQCYWTDDLADASFTLEYKLQEVTLIGGYVLFLVPWVAVGLFLLCLYVWYASKRWSAATPPADTAFENFWSFYSARSKYWVAPISGLAGCVVILALSPDPFDRSSLLTLSLMVLKQFIVLGIILSLFLGLSDYGESDE